MYSDTGLWHIISDLAGLQVTRDENGGVKAVIWSPNPDSDPASDLELVLSNSLPMSYSLNNPVTGHNNPLPGFSGLNFQGWFWRK
jgi:hypothetical protein